MERKDTLYNAAGIGDISACLYIDDTVSDKAKLRNLCEILLFSSRRKPYRVVEFLSRSRTVLTALNTGR